MTPVRPRGRWRRIGPATGVVALSVVLGAATLTGGHHWGDDFASYILQAASLVEGRPGDFVRENAFTIDHSSNVLGPYAYPWGYPLLLAPLYAWRGLDLIALKSLNVALYGLAVALVFVLARPRLPERWALAVSALFAVNPVLLASTDWILSDIPFLAAFLATLAAIDAGVVRRTWPQRSLRHALLLAALLFAMTAIRVVGVVGFALLAACELIERKERAPAGALVRLLPFVLGIASLVAMHALLPFNADSSPYRPPSTYVLANVEYYTHVLAEFFGGWRPRALYAATLPFAMSGMLRRGRVDHPLLLAAAGILACYIAVPLRQGLRYAFPVLPIYVYFVVRGLRLARLTRRPQVDRLLRGGAVLALLAVFGLQSFAAAWANHRDTRSDDGPFNAASREMFDFVRSTVPADGDVVFFKPRALRLLTGRRGFTAAGATLCDAHYAVIYKEPGRGDQVRVDPHWSPIVPCPLDPLFENARFRVFAVRR